MRDDERVLMRLGSGSTYVYGYCDATYQEGWNEEQTVKFVKNSECFIIFVREERGQSGRIKRSTDSSSQACPLSRHLLIIFKPCADS